ncbi:MAG TPA: thermonuclease family protein [Candidatus Paceibacterota bacterium]|nr:thermonuclease family protein [Candidatus Paceibacterota bacterium]
MARTWIIALSICVCGVYLGHSIGVRALFHQDVYMVKKVIDGDTINVSKGIFGKTYTVRLLGINAPESVDPRKRVECFGKEASVFLKHRLIKGTFVYLASDTEKSDTDKYGRLLRYVFTKDSNSTWRLINKEIVSLGYAFEESFGEPYQLRVYIEYVENDAKAFKRGLWGIEGCKAAW